MNMLSLGGIYSGNFLAEIIISIDDVWNQLLTLNPSKSIGPDGCHPRVLGEVRKGIVTPLYLFSRKKVKCQLPGKMHLLQRCIKMEIKILHLIISQSASLTSVICRMLEHIIKNHLLDYFNQNNYFYI